MIARNPTELMKRNLLSRLGDQSTRTDPPLREHARWGWRLVRLAFLPLCLSLACSCVSGVGASQQAIAEFVDQTAANEVRFGAVQKVLDDAVRNGRIPSALAMVAKGDKIVWLGTAGEMGPGVPMRRDAIIPLASVGKMYTAVAAMILYERGSISLDDPVSKYLPEFADVRVSTKDASGQVQLVAPTTPVTIFHLLTHTGGLKVTGDDFWAVWDTHSEKTNTTEFSRALAKLPLQSQPGDAFAYGQTGASYEVLAAVIEIVSRQTLEAFMSDNIFKPLGLKDTHFYLPPGKSERMPAFYRMADGKLSLERPYGQDFPRTTFFHGGGGVEASPTDILQFSQLFLNEGIVGGVRLLKPETVKLMMTDQIAGKPRISGGLGWGFGAAVKYGDNDVEPGHPSQYGWVGGGYATVRISPKDKVVEYLAFPLSPPGNVLLINGFDPLVQTALAARPEPN